jgi:hypothetical protein
MGKIKLNFRNLPVPEKVSRAQQIVTAVSGNDAFTTPSPTLPTITTATNALNTAYQAAQAARQAAKQATAELHVKEDALDKLISQLAAYVESVAGDNEILVQSAGMNIKAPAFSPTDVPGQPQALTATAGDRDGEIDLSWDKVAGAKSYLIEKSPDPPGTWTHAAATTKSNHTIDGLTSGTRFWFRVSALNANGQSGWSDPAMKIAP